jgi:hypothetical protein
MKREKPSIRRIKKLEALAAAVDRYLFWKSQPRDEWGDGEKALEELRRAHADLEVP